MIVNVSLKKDLKSRLKLVLYTINKNLLKRYYDASPHFLSHLNLDNSLDEFFLENIDIIDFSGRLNHENLSSFLQSRHEKTVIFSGGGLLKKNFLIHSEKRFIHIHPGDLPAIRGADGILWSLLMHGCPSYTGFYMKPGIDTGEILIKRHFDMNVFSNYLSDKCISSFTLYRSLLGTLDPWLRAYTLSELLNSDFNSLDCIPSTPQDLNSGETYHFMDPYLRNKVLNLFANVF